MFGLNERQKSLLAAARAWQQEGERRFDYWSRRETLAAAAQAFGTQLRDSGLTSGRPLSDDVRAQLLRLASGLAPNTNLSRRLYAADPAAFDQRLSALLLGTLPLYDRLRQFLGVPRAGALTASQLLCASAPDTYPLITHAALRRLKLTAAQRRNAVQSAAERYGFSVSEDDDAAQNLLGLFVVFEAVRESLGTTTYLEVDDLLRADAAFLPIESAVASMARETQANYSIAPTPTLSEARLLASLEEYAQNQGFVFPPYLLRSYYIALKTKPFVILSGVSGTGKTKMAELLAEALTGHHPGQFRLIPVRPDWADSTPLFGYQNLLANRYVSTPFLDIVRTAGLPENRDRAYFICLDEMNLARVEHYLADYLSALESRAHRIPLDPSVADIILPPNVFVTGTVNVDETTHTFSRKVLDRANTLDFDAAPLLLAGLDFDKGFGLEADLNASPAQRQALFLGARISHAARARLRLAQIDPSFPDRALSLLQAVNDRLYPERLHFAYRVRDDVLLYLANSFDGETSEGLLTPGVHANFALAVDLQVQQKILPRLNGLSERLDPLLHILQAWAEAEALPRTAAKLARMRDIGALTGYVQFYE